MNQNTRFELAKSVLNRTIAIACTNGFDPNDPVIANLLLEEKLLNNFNEQIIEKILTVYLPVINWRN